MDSLSRIFLIMRCIACNATSDYPTLGRYIKVALHPDGWLKKSGTELTPRAFR